MAGIFERMALIFRSKANKALDKHEDPRETLDYSYQRQLELLQKVRRGVADVATSRKRVELQASQLQREADKLTLSAQRALAAGREDLAREALSRKSGLQSQLGDLQAQHSQLQQEEEKLISASTRLQAKVDAFRTKKETIKATYSAAEAQTRINEAFSGISEEMGDVGLAIQRAEDKTLEMQSRAGAVDELLASGALEDPDRQLQGRHHAGAGRDGCRRLRRERAGGSETATRRGRRPSAADRRAASRSGAAESRGRRPDPGRGHRQSGAAGPARSAGAAVAARQPDGSGMIVRVLGEGQWVLGEKHLAKLNVLDETVSRAVEEGDDDALAAALAAMIDHVSTHGTEVPDDVLAVSDIILPDTDMSIAELREWLSENQTDEGLVPD